MATPTPASSVKALPSLSKPPIPQREMLREKECDILDRISVEKAAAEAAREKAASLRARIAKLESMSEELQQTKQRHVRQVQSVLEARERRTTPIPGLGMLTFRTSNFGAGNPVKPSRLGRNSRRTAYTVDFRGTPILGESEFVSHWRLRNAAEQRMSQRDEERIREAASSGNSAAAQRNIFPRFGANGLPTLEFCQHCSSRRMKFYVDYEGKRIMMDPCDWPSDKGFVLTGM